MTVPNEQLTLKKIIGAMLFAARKPLKPAELKTIFSDTSADGEEAGCGQFAKIKESEICAALEQIKIDLIQTATGIHLAEVAGGFRLQTDPECGPWVRRLLNSGKPNHLSKPALETLAIIAYRQPVTRTEIESVRGVNIDHIMRNLLECQLIKIVGRSKLPGHPMLYGTTQIFLEHFGLQSIDHLPGIEQLRRKEEERRQTQSEQPEPENTPESEVDDHVEKADSQNHIAPEEKKDEEKDEEEEYDDEEEDDEDDEEEDEAQGSASAPSPQSNETAASSGTNHDENT